jgi:hypothetical protein
MIPFSQGDHMLKTTIGLMLIVPSLSFAQETKLPNIKIKDVKAWIKANDKDETCADEYLKRRKQLGWSMALAPAAVAGSAVVGALGGGLLGHVAYVASGSTDAWADLGYTVGAGALGAIAGIGISVTSETITTVNFFNNQRLLKVIVESHTELGHAAEVLHRKYEAQYPEDHLSIQDFTAKIADLDLTGKLCDGSIVAPKRHKKGRKLKQNLATKKEIFTHIHNGLDKA